MIRLLTFSHSLVILYHTLGVNVKCLIDFFCIFFGLTDENRTHNHQNHNLKLYHLSYRQHLVGRAGFEPAQSQTGDLQSLGLATCSVSPLFSSILSQLGQEVKCLYNIYLNTQRFIIYYLIQRSLVILFPYPYWLYCSLMAIFFLRILTIRSF